MLISTILRAVDLAAKIDLARLRDDAQYRLNLVKALAADNRAPKR